MPIGEDELTNRVDSLLRADDFGQSYWYTANSSAPYVFTYQFETAPQADYPFDNLGDIGNLVAFSSAEKQVFRDTLTGIESVLNIRFVETSGDPDPGFSFYNADGFRAATGFGGYGSWAYSGTDWDASGVFEASTDLTAPGYRTVVIHEIGHMLGLKHPGNYATDTHSTPPYFPVEEDTRKYSVMSYNEDPAAAWAHEFMVYDVAALQQFWGANTTHASGDTTHTPFDTYEMTTIWDTGGTDIVIYDGADDAVIDLRQGNFSSVAGVDLASVAYDTVLENARSDTGDDRLVGNGADNRLSAGGGRDTLIGRSGNDTLKGGNGADSLHGNSGNDILIGGKGADDLFGDDGQDTASYEKSQSGVRADLKTASDNTGDAAGDSYDSIEGLKGSDHADTLLGTAGANTISGRAGADTLVGRRGDDVLKGGKGKDLLKGGAGDDVLKGGGGSDVFVFTAGADVIRDWSGEDIRLDPALWGGGALDAAGIAGFASVAGGDTVFDFGGGNTLTLSGVTDLDGVSAYLLVV